MLLQFDLQGGYDNEEIMQGLTLPIPAYPGCTTLELYLYTTICWGDLLALEN